MKIMCVSAFSITDIYYLVRKCTRSTDLAYKAIGKLLEIVKACSVTNNDIPAAFQRKAKDFEDRLVAACARSIHCDSIVTRNKKILKNLIFLFSPLQNSFNSFHNSQHICTII